MSYRPITDVWILARAKLKGGVKYYGAYPGGFPERARALLGCAIQDPVLHVCAGMVKLYPYRRGFGPNDKTLDFDPACEPDFLQDANKPFPIPDARYSFPSPEDHMWSGVLIDPPYTAADAKHYTQTCGSKLPSPNALVAHGLQVVRPGGRVGILHYILPKPPHAAIFVAAVAVLVGFNNRVRIYSVFERT